MTALVYIRMPTANAMINNDVIPAPKIGGYMDSGLSKFEVMPSGGGIAETSSGFLGVTMIHGNAEKNRLY